MPVLATVMLLIWPIVVMVLFSRLDKPRAMVWSILAGYLVLPQLVMIDLPAIPGLGKTEIPAMAALAMLFLTRERDPYPQPPPMGGLVVALLAVNIITPIFTAMTNPDPIVDGITYRPALSLSEGIADGILAFCGLIPFILGYRLLWDAKGVMLLMRALVTGILVYSVLMVIEVRLSPQMNVWVYGFFQHDFIQTMRYGGYRPIVFLQHPLWVAFLTMSAFISAVTIARIDPQRRNLLIALYLAPVLLICKSAGALMAAAMAVPLVLLAKPRLMVTFATVLAVTVFAYPIMRSASWMPLQEIVDLAMSASPERGRSLEFRLMNEDILLERAMERPLFGWGGWGRPLFLDPHSGRLASIPDGQWVLWIGLRGVVGYVGQFLLLLLPVLAMFWSLPRRKNRIDHSEAMVLGCVTLILALNMLDLIPNATLTPLTWLMAGSVLGNAHRLRYGVAVHGNVVQPTPMLPKKSGIQTVL